MTKKTFIQITLICLAIILSDIATIINTNEINKIKEEINKETGTTYTCQTIEYVGPELETVTSTTCENETTQIDIYTNKNGNVNVVINGE